MPAPLLFMLMFLSGSRVPGVFSQTAERLPGPVHSRTGERRDHEQKQKWCVKDRKKQKISVVVQLDPYLFNTTRFEWLDYYFTSVVFIRDEV